MVGECESNLVLSRWGHQTWLSTSSPPPTAQTLHASRHLQTPPHPPRALFPARVVPCDRARDPFLEWVDIRTSVRTERHQVPQFMTTLSSYFVEDAQLNLDSAPQFGYHDILCEPLCICPGMAVGCISRSLPSCERASGRNAQSLQNLTCRKRASSLVLVPRGGLKRGDKRADRPSTTVQRSPLLCAPGLVNFITAVARHFCPSLPAAFTQPGAST